jgi:hypothetical protein
VNIKDVAVVSCVIQAFAWAFYAGWLSWRVENDESNAFPSFLCVLASIANVLTIWAVTS